MSAVSEDMHEYHVEEASYEERTKRNRLGLWLFLFSEIFLFGEYQTRSRPDCWSNHHRCFAVEQFLHEPG